MRNRHLRSGLYWIGALLLVLVLLLSIGGLASYVEASGLPFHVIGGAFFAVLGLVFLLLAFLRPRALWKRHFRPPVPAVEERLRRDDGVQAAAFPAEFIGTGLLVAGVAYAATGELLVVLAAWIIIGLTGGVSRFLR